MEHVAPRPPSPLFSAGSRRPHPGLVDLDGGSVAYWIYEPVRATPEHRTILVIHGSAATTTACSGWRTSCRTCA